MKPRTVVLGFFLTGASLLYLAKGGDADQDQADTIEQTQDEQPPVYDMNDLTPGCEYLGTVPSLDGDPDHFDAIFRKSARYVMPEDHDTIPMYGYYAIRFSDNGDRNLNADEAICISSLEVYGDTTGSAQGKDEVTLGNSGIYAHDLNRKLAKIPAVKKYAADLLDEPSGMHYEPTYAEKVEEFNKAVFNGQDILSVESFQPEPKKEAPAPKANKPSAAKPVTPGLI